jgi:hypothetical protein
MIYESVLTIHFWLSAIMSAAGLAAILLKKGSRPHRWAGRIFIGVIPAGIVTGGVLTTMAENGLLQGWVASPSIYLALSGWATMRRWDGIGRPLTIAGAALAAFLIATGLYFTAQELAKPSGAPGGIVSFVVILGLLLWFTALDVKVVLGGGLAGPKRVARHVWRMGLTLAIVSGSTAAAPNRDHPEEVGLLLAAPALLALGLTIFWLIRTLYFGRRRLLGRAPA